MKAKPTQRAAVFIDESWFVLWPRPAEAWARRGRPLRVAKAKSWAQGEAPPSCALYAGMDALTREVSAQWHPTWNRRETLVHLQGVLEAYERRGVRFLIVFWDHGPWHTAKDVRRWVGEHNGRVRQEGGVRVLLFYQPIKAPWLMPLEAVFGQTKRAVGAKKRANLAELQAAVERRLLRRNQWARQRLQHTSSSKAA